MNSRFGCAITLGVHLALWLSWICNISHFYQSAQKTLGGLDAASLIQHTHCDLQSLKLIAVTIFVAFDEHVWKVGANRHGSAHRWLLLLCCGLWDCNEASSWFEVISHELFEGCVYFFYVTSCSLTKFLHSSNSAPSPQLLSVLLWDRLVGWTLTLTYPITF